MAVCMGTTEQVKAIIRQARENEDPTCEAYLNPEAGVAWVMLADQQIYSAIQKGNTDCWIVRYSAEHFK